MRASPPVQMDAETTWMTSDVSPSAPRVLAWPENEGVTARPAARTSVSAASRATVAARRVANPESRQRQRRRESRLMRTCRTACRAPTEQVPRERVGESQPAGRGPLEEDVRQRDERERSGQGRQDPVELPSDSPLGGRKRYDQDGRAADGEEKEARSKNRPAVNRTSTDCDVAVRASIETVAATPRSSTWNTNAPEMGSESAETARHATVYVPGGSSGSSPTATSLPTG